MANYIVSVNSVGLWEKIEFETIENAISFMSDIVTDPNAYWGIDKDDEQGNLHTALHKMANEIWNNF